MDAGNLLIVGIFYGVLTLPLLLILILKLTSPFDHVGSLDESSQAAPEQPTAGLAPTSTAVSTTAVPSVSVLQSAELSWASRLKAGLLRTRSQMVRNLDELFLSRESKTTREDTLEKIFELLIRADVGVRTSELLVGRVRDGLVSAESFTLENVKALLKKEILELFESVRKPTTSTLEHPAELPHVVMMVGVNGVGKTTTTGKLAFKCSQLGQAVVVGAADTFRAAAVEQLAVWADRARATLVRLKEGSDPASVAFETVKIAKASAAQVCLVDTAGRLHNRADLMQELSKIKRVMGKEVAAAPHEVLLVLDATTGQNALSQARIFKEVVEITGLVLTKLDGTAKGGVALAVVSELQLPIRYLGVGETVEDLHSFDAVEFVEALFAPS